MEKKILIIDDEQDAIANTFKLANAYAFENKLRFSFAARSQDVDYASLKEKFDLVVIDITLAKKSELDGYGIIKKIVDNDYFDLKKIFILTGNSQIETELEKRGLPSSIRTVIKPVNFLEISDVLKEFLSYEV